MVKSEDTIEVEAIVKAALPNAMFRLEIQMGPNKHEIIGHISGKMRRNYIRITPATRSWSSLAPTT
jgi:translation initiation factor IF-1